jgi:hypothetical protein
MSAYSINRYPRANKFFWRAAHIRRARIRRIQIAIYDMTGVRLSGGRESILDYPWSDRA